MGPAGQPKPGESDAQLGGLFECAYRHTGVDTIGGGSAEVQKNDRARRELGLPKNF